MTFAMRQSVMTARANKSASAPNSLSSMSNARLIIPLPNVPSKRRRLRQHKFARFMRPQQSRHVSQRFGKFPKDVGGTVMRGKSTPSPERDSIQTLVATKCGGEWCFAAFQNTRVRPIGRNTAETFVWILSDWLWKVIHPKK